MSFPVRDPVLGEEVAAMVVRNRKSVSETDVRNYLLDHLQPGKIPRWIYFVDSIPKNASGKPVRSEGTRVFGGQER
jgi:acyl-CoA synthetase (AMP-forming)/AMP-acid ligase II